MAENEKKNYKELNVWVGMGRLGSAPTFTQKGEEKKVARFSLAVNNGTENADWIDIVAFGHNAQFANDHLSKGSKVVVQGRIATSPYTDKDGIKRKGVNIIASSISFAESRKNSDDNESEETSVSTESTEEVNADEAFPIPDEFQSIQEGLDDDDFPFKS